MASNGSAEPAADRQWRWSFLKELGRLLQSCKEPEEIRRFASEFIGERFGVSCSFLDTRAASEPARPPAHPEESILRLNDGTLVVPFGESRGFLHLRREDGSDFSPAEVSVLEEAAWRCGEAVARANFYIEWKESRERHFIALESANLASWDWDVEKNSVVWNDSHFLLLGLEPHERDITTEFFSSFIHPEDRERVESSLSASVATATPFHAMFRIIRPNTGEQRWMSGFGRPVSTRNGKTVRMTGVMYDTTELRQQTEDLRHAKDELEFRVTQRTQQLESALTQLHEEVARRETIERERRELLERLVHTQEDERSRVARELHDNLGQHMVAVLLHLDSFQRQLAQSTPLCPARIDELRAVVDAMIKATHRQSWELRPAELDELGLEAAIEKYVGHWQDITGIATHFHLEGKVPPAPNPEAVIALYRVMQEALTNVARHAEPSAVSVMLCCDQDGGLELTVHDDGRGFDPSSTGCRLGLLGMQERMEIVRGSLELLSKPGEGTTVTAIVPGPSEVPPD